MIHGEVYFITCTLGQYIILHNDEWPIIELDCNRAILLYFLKVDGKNFYTGVRTTSALTLPSPLKKLSTYVAVPPGAYFKAYSNDVF